jgi:hypothetical protein
VEGIESVSQRRVVNKPIYVGGDNGSATDTEGHVMSTLGRHWLHRRSPHAPVYRLTDRLNKRTTRVAPDEIAATVSGWLAEMGVESPLVDAFAEAVCVGDWAAAYAFGDLLSIDVVIAA